jgi:hypothetical protein
LDGRRDGPGGLELYQYIPGADFYVSDLSKY